MIENNNKCLIAVEFDKILELLKNEAICEETKRMITRLKPRSNFDLVTEEIQKTDDAYKLSISYCCPEINFKFNMYNILDKIKISAQLMLKEFRLISDFLNNISHLIKWKRQSEDKNTSIDYLFNKLIFLKELKTHIDSVVLSEDEIADDASRDLFDIRAKLRAKSGKVKDSLNDLIKSSVYQKCLQDPIVTMRDGRYVVPVKSEYRSEIKGLVHDSSASGSTLFIEPVSVIDINNEIKILQNQEVEEINKILNQLSNEVKLYTQEITQSYKSFLFIDLYFAKAKLALKMNAVAPKVNQEGKINLISARHPLIDAKKVVPIDVNLGYTFDDLIITGPNTGGKTVALKTVGLLTLMAMSGLMIPACDGSEVAVFEDVLVDIGDEQSIEQSLSTFSAHMVNIISILKQANNRTLVLVDELGSGTDPIEGASLAISILEEFRLKGSKVIATTHYSEIKLYALKTNRVINSSCEFDVKTLKPTYKLRIGMPGKSNAFLICKRLGLDECVLDRAKSIISDETNKFEDALAEIEHKTHEIEKQKKEIDDLRTQIEISKNELILEKQEIEENKNKELKKAREKADKIIVETQNEAQQILAQLNEAIKKKDDEDFYKIAYSVSSQIKSKFKKLNRFSDLDVKNSIKDEIIYHEKIQSGDKVKIVDLGQKGIVLRNEDSNGYYLVQVGSIKSKVHKSNLAKIKEGKLQSKIVVNKNFNKKLESKVETEINLIGQTVDEAILDLERFIDNAVLMGLSVIRVVHGKGAGILRTAVANYLKSDKHVKSYRLGIYGEGEDGVTIVTLK